MKLLLDTQLLLWAKSDPSRVSPRARKLIEDTDNLLFFSVVSLWEIVIKNDLGRPDFRVDAPLLRRKLLRDGYRELVVTSHHAFALAGLPPLHRDPFDRLLVAQAASEGFVLVTEDAAVARYRGPVRKV
ncbi:MAG: type II toxin-antitoxin system VapC family toxin [Sphingosinicella sp.]